ncbi:MAG TPA: cell division protein FtsA, partial [Oceanospirillaceae bacterium]|nr:cell division protein FtsA [Oceanospirillaceae bacterium]
MADISDTPMLVSLDIGTSKVVAMVAEVPAQGELRIAGVSCQPARGLKRGMIVDIESTVMAIKRAIEEAELMAECKIESLTVGIG